MQEKGGFSKRGQITIFVIVAIVIVAGVVLLFAFKDRIFISEVPAQLQPVYSYYDTCMQRAAEDGARIMGEKGGYIEVPEFEAGSLYRPFSSHLDFFNFAIPYWYYVKGNGIAKEQVPSLKLMQQQLGDFISEQMQACDFSAFRQQGFVINTSSADATATISDEKIDVSVSESLVVSFGDKTARKTSHSVSVNSKLGKFYNLAKKIYDKEESTLFLENYAVDILYNYAPVTGVEISCSPKTWFATQVKQDIQNAVEANMMAIKIKGDYYSNAGKYFVQDLGENSVENVNFLYSKNFPTRIEIWPGDELMLAEPVGLQQGMGILGFCYVPYHFVYDLDFPVLIQIFDNKESFQFPIAVVVDRNRPRVANVTEGVPDAEPELCKNMNKDVSVSVYDNNLAPLQADIKFKCFSTECDIGKTGENGIFTGKFPACVNGVILASADGYAEKKYQISTNEESAADIILDKTYPLNLELKIDGADASDMAIINFEGANRFTLAWPEQKEIKLSEGLYNVSVYVYKNSSITIPGTKQQKCIDAPKKGILGVLGATEQQCFDLDIPSQTISGVISAGGKLTGYYPLESELKQGKKIEINARSIPFPTDITKLQDAYLQLDSKVLGISIT